jgi:proteic killer suppression protein
MCRAKTAPLSGPAWSVEQIGVQQDRTIHIMDIRALAKCHGCIAFVRAVGAFRPVTRTCVIVEHSGYAAQRAFSAWIRTRQAVHTARLHILLTALDGAISADDMDALAWRFHKLSGKNPKGQSIQDHWSVSVNGNWRLTFCFEIEHAVLVDY